MTEEEIMQALRLAAKAREKDDPATAWDALAAGALTDAERAELLASDADGSLAAVFEPLGADFEAELLASLSGAPAQQGPTEPAPSVHPPTPSANSNRWWLAALPLVALAAAFLVLFMWPSSAPLPEFAFEVTGGDQVVRGDPQGLTVDARRVLSPGSRLTLIARPPEAMTEAVSASVLVREGAVVRLATSDVDVSPTGAVRWTGTAGTEPLTPEVSAVILVLHHPGTAPQSIIDAARSHTGLPVHEVPVRIKP